DSERLEQSSNAAHVLLGEELRGDHDRGLVSVLDREQRGEQRDDGLAAADVALQQPLHAAVAGHIGDDLANGAHPRAGELERKTLAQLRGERAPVDELNARPMGARELLRALLKKLDEEQLFESET